MISIVNSGFGTRTPGPGGEELGELPPASINTKDAACGYLEGPGFPNVLT